MATATYKFLHFTNLKDIPNWSVQYADEEDLGFTNKFPMARIGSFLTRRKESVDIQDGVIYKRVTVSTKGGNISIRDEKDGKDIGTKKQFLIHEGQFLLSKIDARNGAYGVVPAIAEKAIITGNFWTFDVDYSIINPQFLTLITKTKEFLLFAEKSSNGTTNRHYLQEKAFLNQQIPLPSIEEQEEILEEYNDNIHLSVSAFNEIENLKNQIETYLRKELDFKYEKSVYKGFMHFVSFKNIKRWDVQYYSSENHIISQYATTTIGDSLVYFMKDAISSLRIETYKFPDKDFHYIGMENIHKGDGELINLPIVKGTDIKSQTVRIPKGFFIFGKLRPYLNKYWLNDMNIDDIVCSSEFFCFKVKETFNREFFKYILSSYIVQAQISEAMSGARMPRIDEKTFKSIVIPNPPMSIQEKIANDLNALTEQIEALKENVQKLQEEAFIRFSNNLFEK
ncbi:MAG: restriction endonuclease subunit S [Bacteroidaceae bacterium]|nr:restriction endonuclease subunit S [Bacteroidaceae bacterium]